jgi:hypothetical protein
VKREERGYTLFIVGCLAALFFVLAFADYIDRWGERDQPKIQETRR